LGDANDLRVMLSARPELPVARSETPRTGSYALTVANDYPHKDWDGLIDLFSSRSDLPQLLIVGAPRSRRRFRDLKRRIANSANPQGVELSGSIDDRATLSSIYAQASIYLAHSRLEAFPLTPYEAMGFGLDVVASDIPPHREVCGDAATYYAIDDHEALALVLKDGAIRRCRPDRINRSWGDNAIELAQVLSAAAR
jgi:glycosyltransferase involved in cell wall biosynthesis